MRNPCPPSPSHYQKSTSRARGSKYKCCGPGQDACQYCCYSYGALFLGLCSIFCVLVGVIWMQYLYPSEFYNYKRCQDLVDAASAISVDKNSNSTAHGLYACPQRVVVLIGFISILLLWLVTLVFVIVITSLGKRYLFRWLILIGCLIIYASVLILAFVITAQNVNFPCLDYQTCPTLRASVFQSAWLLWGFVFAFQFGSILVIIGIMAKVEWDSTQCK